MTILSILLCILILVLLITWLKVSPFIAFLITSIVGGIFLGIPIDQVPLSIEKGIGNMLGSLASILVISAMFGKLVSDSGAAQRIASALMNLSGPKYLNWALMLTGFIVGIPIFYNVGFVLLVPLIFSVAYQFKLPVVSTGISLLAAMSVTHGYLPPHPSPTAIVPMLGASMSKTLIYGIIVAIPSMILAGPIFAKSLRKIEAHPLEIFKPQTLSKEMLPGKFNSFFTALLPVMLIGISSFLPGLISKTSAFYGILLFFSNPTVDMLITLIFATISLGVSMGTNIKKLMETYANSIKDISLVLFIIAGAGALKQVFVDSGVSNEIAGMLKGLNINVLLLGWLIATMIRICVGSATVSGLTTAGIISPLVLSSHVNPNLMVLAIGAGSLMFSHVNDSGFWMFKEYFNVSLKDTLRSWSLMETIVGTVGIIGVLLLDLMV